MCFLFPATDGVTLLLVLACCSFTGAHGQCDDARGHLSGHQLTSMALAGLTCCVAQRHQPHDRAAKAGRPTLPSDRADREAGKGERGNGQRGPKPAGNQEETERGCRQSWQRPAERATPGRTCGGRKEGGCRMGGQERSAKTSPACFPGGGKEDKARKRGGGRAGSRGQGANIGSGAQ